MAGGTASTAIMGVSTASGEDTATVGPASRHHHRHFSGYRGGFRPAGYRYGRHYGRYGYRRGYPGVGLAAGLGLGLAAAAVRPAYYGPSYGYGYGYAPVRLRRPSSGLRLWLLRRAWTEPSPADERASRPRCRSHRPMPGPCPRTSGEQHEEHHRQRPFRHHHAGGARLAQDKSATPSDGQAKPMAAPPSGTAMPATAGVAGGSGGSGGMVMADT